MLYALRRLARTCSFVAAMPGLLSQLRAPQGEAGALGLGPEDGVGVTGQGVQRVAQRREVAVGPAAVQLGNRLEGVDRRCAGRRLVGHVAAVLQLGAEELELLLVVE